VYVCVCVYVFVLYVFVIVCVYVEFYPSTIQLPFSLVISTGKGWPWELPEEYLLPRGFSLRGKSIQI